jgi:tellurite resistance protein TerC
VERMEVNVWFWVGFNTFVLILLVLDLGVFHRRAHSIGVKEALLWTSFWISLALGFNLGIYLLYGSEPALAFLTGYLVEESLSVDNLFVMALIFSYFKVPQQYQHRVLFWGIMGAIIMRAGMIFVGVSIIDRFHWAIYLFGAFLILTGIRMALQDEMHIEPEKNPVVRAARRIIPVTPTYREGKFFVRESGRLMATPLFIVVLMVEVTDLVFAVDSIPAILGITTDPFIVYTSNVFAILGLRSLYFALAAILGIFHYLKFGLSLILIFIGVKMVCEGMFHIPIGIALGVVATILAGSIFASILWPSKESLEVPTDLPGAPQ